MVGEASNLPVFSFILPTFNEKMNIEVLAQRLISVGNKLERPYEILFVDDGSSDGTDEVLDRLAEKEPTVRVVHFSRNFGHMAALTAGLENALATGAIVCLDADGQHPPELIPEMVERWEKGVDIVQTIRVQTSDATVVKKVTSNFFYKLFDVFADIELPQGTADFRLMDRQVVEAINSLPEKNRFIRGLVYWIGFKKETIPYNALPRLGGTTKYNLLKMLSFALSGITSFSNKPLRLSFLVGVFVTCCAGLYALFILYCYFSGYKLVPGWSSMLFVTLMLSGVQLISLGIASEYLARIYFESKRRPVYIVRSKHSTDSNAKVR
jgi:dolichol-phosphate mannosyltransferase